MSNITIKCEYAVNIVTGACETMVIFKPTQMTATAIKKWLEEKPDEYRTLDIHDASGDHVSHTPRRIITWHKADQHNTIILTTL